MVRLNPRHFLQAHVPGKVNANAYGNEDDALDDDSVGIFQSIRFWQGWAIFATAAALFTFVANAEFSVDGHTPDYVAVVGDAEAPLWVINADLGEGSVHVRAAAANAPAEGEEYVLWIAGPTPQRLGALPVGRVRTALKLSSVATALLGHGKTLGVVIEPVADGPKEAPTDWLYQASIARL